MSDLEEFLELYSRKHGLGRSKIMAPVSKTNPISGYFREFLEREYGVFISRPPKADPAAGHVADDEPDPARPANARLTLSPSSEELSS